MTLVLLFARPPRPPAPPGSWTTGRDTPATYFDAAGVLRTAAPYEARPRFVGGVQDGYIAEPAAANAVPHTGDPARWNAYGAAGVAVAFVGSGVENGVPYGEFSVRGTATAEAQAGVSPFPAGASAPVAAGDARVLSAYVRLVSAPAPPANPIAFQANGSSAAGGYTETPIYAALDATAAAAPLGRYRVAAAGTFAAAATASATLLFQFSVSAGRSIDLVLRVGLPQFEAGATPTSAIPTAGSATARAADAPYRVPGGVRPRLVWID